MNPQFVMSSYEESPVIIDSWAWLPKHLFTSSQLTAIKGELTIYPEKMQVSANETDNGPIELFQETATRLGVAREYFLQKVTKLKYEIACSDGDKSTWPGDLEWDPAFVLREEQQKALDTFLRHFENGGIGGLLSAPCAWGKTIWASSLIQALQVPTLVVVHKEFLMKQWKDRLESTLPHVQIGICQQDVCDFEGKHVVIGMVHSMASKEYSQLFYNWPGLIIVDEAHRIAARSWALVPGKFKSKLRLGVSATIRRKDGTENVFNYSIGRIIFRAKEKRLIPIIKRIHSKFKMVRANSFNPNLAPESVILGYLCKNEARNSKIIETLLDAVKAGRKVIVVSKRLPHLEKLDGMLRRECQQKKLNISIGWYVGGMKEEQLEASEECQVIFGTVQFCSEGLDIPALDTIFLTVPVADIEQLVGRILRPYTGKKDPIVVDIRDDLVPVYAAYSRARERQYEAMIGATSVAS